jgi:coenzyme F420-reducing hydrogenase delta subunit
MAACEGCGICAAECPNKTIHMKGRSSLDIKRNIAHIEQESRAEALSPLIVAFCCSRSAFRAWELAVENGHKLPSGLKTVEVPCAGSISSDHILSVMKKGADGIMVLTCHNGNCHSEIGNIYARQRMDVIYTFFEQSGLEKQRLAFGAFAANMELEFSKFVRNFEKKINAIGSSFKAVPEMP